jgi:hypothetical protein
MLIIVPSYKRTDCLYWVLKSICRCNISAISEEKKVVVVNNHPPSRNIIDSIIAKFNDDKIFTWQALHREETLPPIDSWYSAVAQFAAEGEVVVLLGDDDLMLPWGLQDRYREIVNGRADMVLSDFADRIFFFHGGQDYWMTSPMPVENEQEKHAQEWEFFPAKYLEASFISSHCYRNTVNFRNGLELALVWCDSQSWLERGTRTGMLPFYLPYAIACSGGKVISLYSKCVFRGAYADESIKSTYADGGNVAFYSLCAYDVLVNRTLPKHTELLAQVGARFKQGVVRGYFTMVFDNKIPWKTLKRTCRHAGLKLRDFMTVAVFHGVFLLLKELLGLRGARLKLKRRSMSLSKMDSIFR